MEHYSIVTISFIHIMQKITHHMPILDKIRLNLLKMESIRYNRHKINIMSHNDIHLEIKCIRKKSKVITKLN